MAVINIPITYPDAAQARVMAALKKHWTTREPDPQNPGQMIDVVPTNAQITTKIGESIKASLRDIVQRIERDAAHDAAVAAVVPVDFT